MMRVFAAALFLIILSFGSGRAAETITSFRSDIQVEADGDLIVTETIAVVAEGRDIRRGIYRDFPTVRGRTWWGAFRTSFEVQEVLRDGAPEPWFTQSIPGGTRLYIGNADRTVSRGPHTYAITYRTDRQLGFFENHDELYWNVTGNFWSFPIERASAVVRLPQGAAVSSADAFTGRAGDTSTDAEFAYPAGGATVTATRAFRPGEGLTIAITWPKGFVTEPTAMDALRYAARDNLGVLAGLAGLSIVFAFYLWAWSHYGRDPARGTIVAEYDPPKNLSPAACRYILNMSWDQKAFTSAVVDMAARGFMSLNEGESEKGKKVFTLTRTDKTEAEAELSPGERAIAKELFAPRRASITLDAEERSAITGAISALRRALAREHGLVHFVSNAGLLWIGSGLSAAAIGAMLALSPDSPPADMIAGGFIGFVAILIYFGIKNFLKGVREGGTGRRLVTVMGLVAALVFGGQFAAIFFKAAQVTAESGWASGLLSLGGLTVVMLAIINLIFFEIMKAPTLLGRRLMDHIEGFKHYLTVAEQDRLNFHNPPELTPERFEAFLPYAIALDVENEWGEQFNGAMARVAAERGETWRDQGYTPRWYAGGFRSGAAGWGALGSALTSSIATAATPPSSSSGGGRGGFSGGGGGGGGGGGW